MTVRRDDFTRTATVAPCPDGCWLILGEGYNRGWSASAGGRGLGAPRQLSGGFSAWQLPPSTSPTTVTMTWRPQTGLDVALALSVAGIVLCLVLVWFGRRGGEQRTPVPLPRFVRRVPVVSRRQAVVAGAVALVASALLISWSFAIVGLVIAAVVVLTRRPLLCAIAAVVLAGLIGLDVLWRQHRDLFFVNASWPGQFEKLHHWGLLVVVLLLTSVVVPSRPPDAGSDDAFVSRR